MLRGALRDYSLTPPAFLNSLRRHRRGKESSHCCCDTCRTKEEPCNSAYNVHTMMKKSAIRVSSETLTPSPFVCVLSFFLSRLSPSRRVFFSSSPSYRATTANAITVDDVRGNKTIQGLSIEFEWTRENPFFFSLKRCDTVQRIFGDTRKKAIQARATQLPLA